MNERIKELAEQSGMTQYVASNNKYLERFAELLIAECTDCAVWVGKVNTSPVEPASTAHAIVLRIQKELRG